MIPAGSGRIEVRRRGGRSVVTRAIAASPLQLLTPRNHGPGAWIYTATHGGGLVDGDAVRLELSVGPEAIALLSTQASTKVYRSTGGSSLELAAAVSADGLLVILPDPVVCFAAAACRVNQRVDLERDAALVLLEWLSSGRHAAGERWRFNSYASRIAVYQAGRLVMLDALSLDRADGDLTTRMGRFNVLCLIVLIGRSIADHAARVMSQVAAAPVLKRAPLAVGASPIAGNGCVLRIAGVSFEEVASATRDFLQFLPGVLGDDPWARKW